METVKPQRQLIRPGLVPSQTLIRDRMMKRFGEMKFLTLSVISPCAEEAERMMCEMLEERSVGVKRKGFKDSERHYCPSCQTQNIYQTYHYCPKCGAQIKWI
jgi:hypothetical protein